MADIQTEILRANERWKAASNVLCNLGSALFAGGVVALWTSPKFDPWHVGWIVIGTGTIFVGMFILTFLMSET